MALDEERMHIMNIANAIREVQGYIGRSDYESYAMREDVRQAVSNQLLQIGGAAAMLSDDFKDRYSDVDWDTLVGLQYAGYDQELELDAHQQWYIVSEDLPQIMNQVLDLATRIEREEEGELDLTDEDSTEYATFHNPEDGPYFGNPDPGQPKTGDGFAENPEDDEYERYVARDRNALSGEDSDEPEEEDIDSLNIDMIDDSYIDQRFTDEDLMKGSSLDDDVYGTEDER
jgi:uncharacterized protein with HEPN domain